MNNYVIPLISEATFFQPEERTAQVVNLEKALDIQFKYNYPCVIIVTPFHYE